MEYLILRSKSRCFEDVFRRLEVVQRERESLGGWRLSKEKEKVLGRDEDTKEHKNHILRSSIWWGQKAGEN